MLQTLLSDDTLSKFKRSWFARFRGKHRDAQRGTEIKARQEAVLALYAFFALIDERRKGSLPAWEGICIVREPITELPPTTRPG